MLAARGAAVVDADVAARQVLAPGGPAYDGVARRFPSVVQSPGAAVDRSALAAIVFADPAARRDLEALTHPAIRELMAAQTEASASSEVVVAVIPLLVEAPGRRPELDAVVVVDCPPEVALARVVARGMPAGQARARMAAQASREERLARADHVVDNGGALDRLTAEVDRCWEWARRRAAAARG